MLARQAVFLALSPGRSGLFGSPHSTLTHQPKISPAFSLDACFSSNGVTGAAVFPAPGPMDAGRLFTNKESFFGHQLSPGGRRNPSIVLFHFLRAFLVIRFPFGRSRGAVPFSARQASSPHLEHGPG